MLRFYTTGLFGAFLYLKAFNDGALGCDATICFRIERGICADAGDIRDAT
jgi:hypothetical protein